MYLLLLDAFVQGWILGDFGPWMAYSGILLFMHSLTEGWGVKGAALYFLKLWGPAWSSSSMSHRGLSTYVLNTQPLSLLLKSSKGLDPPVLTHRKQQRPTVTTVGFWIQYNKIALSLSPSRPPCVNFLLKESTKCLFSHVDNKLFFVHPPNSDERKY